MCDQGWSSGCEDSFGSVRVTSWLSLTVVQSQFPATDVAWKYQGSHSLWLYEETPGWGPAAWGLLGRPSVLSIQGLSARASPLEENRFGHGPVPGGSRLV